MNGDTAEYKSDVSRPSALPSARLRAHAPAEPAAGDGEASSAAYLDAFEEDWNKRIDGELDVLVEGMHDLVALAAVGAKDKVRVAQEAFQAQCRAEAMVRAAHSLLSIAHAMKLLLLLSDETQIANRRDAELARVRAEATATQADVAQLLDGMLGRGGA